MAACRRAVPLLLMLPALLPGCGSMGRTHDAAIALQRSRQIREPAERDEALATLRGAEPLLGGAWLASASMTSDPEAALVLVRRGLDYLPAESDLILAELSIVGQLRRWDEEVLLAQRRLGQDPPAGLRAQVLWFLIEGLVGQGQLDEASRQCVRLGGVPGSLSAMLSAAWARVALAREVAGQSDEADTAMDNSLDRGPTGVSVLRHDALAAEEKLAAAGRLVQRAVVRQPDHPDLRLFRLVDRMAGGDLQEAEAMLDALPQPLPERLLPETIALRARLLLVQGRTEEGLAVLRSRLEEQPADAFALGVLLESWHARGQPAAEEVAAWLRAGRRNVTDPALAAEMDSTLKDIAARQKAAKEPAAEPNGEPAKP
jgi:tetratricopeptide (TPR) repeat protein